ncbi:MAG: hypothetical protein GX303_01395, partial [Clostridiales bacterium]|nr:hypothetical protein [Clostridiales bacterium]
NRMYPPAALFVAATSKGNLLAFFAFFLLSVAPFALFALIVTKVFRTFRTYLTTTATRSKFDINQGYAKQTRTKSALHTLYLKEARRYFASPIYVVNTIVGVVMVFLLSVVLLFGGNAMLDELFKIPEVSQKIGAIVPLLIASIVGMTNPAAISLSMEGKAFPLLKSLPVSAMTVFSAKILFTLTLTVPTVLINAPLVIFALKLDLFKSIMTFLIPLLFCFLTALFGICVNLLFPNFKWTSEVSVVKQSMASIFGVLVPMTVGFAGAIGIGFIKTEIADIVLIAIAILFTLLSLLLHTFPRKRGESIYLKLI